MMLTVRTHAVLEAQLRRGEKLRVLLDRRDVTDDCSEAWEGNPGGYVKLLAAEPVFSPATGEVSYTHKLGNVQVVVRTRSGWRVPYTPSLWHRHLQLLRSHRR